MKGMRKEQRGLALTAAYMVVAVIFILSGAMHMRSVQDKGLSDRYINGMNAFYLAESGIDQALVNLRANPSAPSIPYTSSNVIQGGYQVNIENVGATLRRFTSIGYVPSNNPAGVAYMERRLEGYASNTAFGLGIFGVEEIELKGNVVVDSYDSSLNPNPITFNSNGSVGTNAVNAGAVELQGNTRVLGNVLTGPGSNPSLVVKITGNAYVSGSLSAQNSAMQVSAPIVPPGTPNGGNLTLTGSTTLTLPGGTYWYNKIDMSGNSSLIFTGKTNLYVSGKVSLNGNNLITTQAGNGNNLPTNLTLYVVTTDEVEFSGNGRIYSAIYAPRSEFEASGNVQIYGGVVAKEIEMNGNANLHYDEALTRDGLSSSNDWRLISWREVFNP